MYETEIKCQAVIPQITRLLCTSQSVLYQNGLFITPVKVDLKLFVRCIL